MRIYEKPELKRLIKECINEINDENNIKRAWSSIRDTKKHIESVKLKMKKYAVNN